MNKSILITGVTGTGKSAVCDELNKLGYKAFGIEDIDGLFTMVHKKTGKPFKDYDNDDFEKVKQADWICDKKKLQRLMQKNSKGVVFYNGTASNLDDLLPLFDKIFLLKVDKKILLKRLSTRTSNDFARTTEVQKWVFSWKTWWENNMREKGVTVIDANRSLRKVANDIIERSKSSSSNNMTQNLYKKAEKFVTDSYTKIGKTSQIKHFKRTVYWIKQLKADADEALLISAIAHDIERAYRKEDMLKKKRTLSYTNPKFFRPHEERGAEIMAEFLKKEGAQQKLIDRVKMLISKHEEGGNEDQNLLKDADSISFFENNVSTFLTKHLSETGKEKVREKFDWMFNRITSGKAKKIVRQWYKEAIKKLEE